MGDANEGVGDDPYPFLLHGYESTSRPVLDC